MAGVETFAIEYSRAGDPRTVRIRKLTQAQADDVWAMVCESLDRTGGTGWMRDGGRVVHTHCSEKEQSE